MSAQTFIAQIAPVIQAEAKNRGYDICSATIAQAVIESGNGASGLAKYHNYFGLKCGSSWKGKSVNMKTKEEYTVGTLTTIKDNFRVYDNMTAGVAGYYDFISTKRYANLKTAKTYKEFATFLKQDGYATSSTYITTLCNCVERYGLTKYDTATSTSQTATSKTPVVKKGDRNDYVLHIQKFLAAKGYTVGAIDGIFGTKTEDSVKQYQYDNNLTVDGIWGPECWSFIGVK